MSRAREIRVGLVYIPVDSVQNLNIIVGTRSDWIKSTNLTDNKFFSVIGCRLNGDNDYFLDGVAATDIPENGSTPIVEAMQFENGLGLLVQFHPERMENSAGKKILKLMVEIAKSNRDERRLKGCQFVY